MIVIRHPSKNLVVEATIEFCVECEGCNKDIDIGEIEDKLKLITDISVYFFCKFECLFQWATKTKLEESEKET